MKIVKFLMSSAVCLLPLVLSVILYEQLPDQVAIHWDMSGTPNNFVHKSVAAFGMPFIFLALDIFIKFILFNDPKKANAAEELRTLAVWIIPIMSVIMNPMTLIVATGRQLPVQTIVLVFVGVLFIFIGMYLPKNKQNYTIGIRVPWTLHSEENWVKTHKLAGVLWVLGGILLILGSLIFHGSYLVIGIVSVITVIPVMYSFLLYKKSEGKEK